MAAPQFHCHGSRVKYRVPRRADRTRDRQAQRARGDVGWGSVGVAPQHPLGSISGWLIFGASGNLGDASGSVVEVLVLKTLKQVDIKVLWVCIYVRCF